MDSQNYIEYEISDSISGKRFFSRSYDEALAYYENGWYVVERHITIGVFSMFESCQTIMCQVWNNNPQYKEINNDNKND
jgi:hypothetical protein